ncbi:hypothetical protein Avbf_10943 [Armadillidium vulgare]|nr:hypothetical protein Avbf_10943 [Armadillidium vulgare]
MLFSNLGSYFIANTFAPTFMMLTVGYLTLYFPIEKFNERIMVSLTALLVQSSFFTELFNISSDSTKIIQSKFCLLKKITFYKGFL